MVLTPRACRIKVVFWIGIITLKRRKTYAQIATLSLGRCALKQICYNFWLLRPAIKYSRIADRIILQRQRPKQGTSANLNANWRTEWEKSGSTAVSCAFYRVLQTGVSYAFPLLLNNLLVGWANCCTLISTSVRETCNLLASRWYMEDVKVGDANRDSKWPRPTYSTPPLGRNQFTAELALESCHMAPNPLSNL
jgi:hypothetical protein